MELTLWAKDQGATHTDANVRSALGVIGESAGHIKQAIAKLKASQAD